MENIATKSVALRRRATTPGILIKGTPTVITSNRSPEDLFGQERGMILRSRMMVVNCRDVQLFPLLGEICSVNGLEEYVEDEYAVPEDI